MSITDATISATVRALRSAREDSIERAAERIGINSRTLKRRLHDGGWTATEVAEIADAYGIEVADLYAGRVRVAVTHGMRPTDERPAMYVLAA